jgi:hypothetical protein
VHKLAVALEEVQAYIAAVVVDTYEEEMRARMLVEKEAELVQQVLHV